MRRIYKAGLAAVTGYGAYISWYQIYSAHKIAERQLLPQSHFDDPTQRFAPLRIHGRFVNPFAEYRHQTLFEFAFRRVQELLHIKTRTDIPKDQDELSKLLLSHTPLHAILAGEKVKGFPPPNQRMTLTWIGQSCALVQLPAGQKQKPINILTDPMFSNSVVSKHVGPQRLFPAPCTLDDLPSPDVVLVSHDHQDHLDLKAASEIGNSASWVVPIGVGKHLKQVGIENVQELTWWEKIPLPNTDRSLGYEVACTPAMHWSGRNLIDANQTLWCSFLILRHGKPWFYHAGDTGYADGLFRGIAKVYGSGCILAMMPCGAYTPQWHLKSQHMCPEEAIQAMKDLSAKNIVGVHWGTFMMSEEPFLEPKQLIEAHKADPKDTSIVAPPFGETLVYKV